MLKSRLFEAAVAKLWEDGFISGEMHLGTGEEAVVAGTVTHLREDDAMALDHRGTAALLMRGVDPIRILRELLGRADGLCGGMGGHMHLFSKEHLAASSGIVGASGPAAVGFALAGRRLRPGTVSLAFFGEGAMNQGMLMEAMNLASAWSLPVVFVCKDDGWSITTESAKTTGGTVADRAQGFGIPAFDADGWKATRVWETAKQAFDLARSGGGPAFLHLRCVHLEGHFLGYPLLRMARSPLEEIPAVAPPLMRSFFRSGGPPAGRLAGLKEIVSAVLNTLRDPRTKSAHDPVVRARAALRESDPDRLREMEERTGREINAIVSSAMQGETA
jgi:pyruvate dehydrogenase E1 component alpha subunit